MQGPRSKFSSGGGGGLKKNAWRKIFMLNYFLFNLFLFLQKSGGGEGLKPPQPLPLRGPWHDWSWLTAAALMTWRRAVSRVAAIKNETTWRSIHRKQINVNKVKCFLNRRIKNPDNVNKYLTLELDTKIRIFFHKESNETFENYEDF